MKRVLCVLFATMLAGQVWAYDFKSGNLYYNITSGHSVEVTFQYQGSNDNYSGLTTVDIPEKVSDNGVEYVVTSIGEYAFYGCSSLQSAVIGNSIKCVGEYAFYDCSGLESLTISNSVEDIGEFAFYNCPNLNYYEYDNAYYIGNGENPYVVLMEVKRQSIISCEINCNCKFIYDEAFKNCSGLISVTIPISVVGIGNSAFRGCDGLTSVFIPNSVINIGNSAFSDCRGLEFLTIGNSVKNIGDYAFFGCWYITSISIPNSVTSIGRFAFDGIFVLKSVIIGDALTYIGNNAFSGCRSLDYIVSMGETPPQIESADPFPNTDTIYVKEKSVSTYKNAVIWKRKEILPFYILSVKSEDISMGIVDGDSILLGNKLATVTAIPNEGYHFVKWSDDNTDNPRHFSSAKDVSITAYFAKHSVIVDTVVEATCTETGLTEGKHCSVCGKVIVAQKVIPALGHEFVNYIYNKDTSTETAQCEHGCGVSDTRAAEGTKIAENTATAISIYAYGSAIVIENADAEIFVYDAMGKLICRDATPCVRTELLVNTAGVYIVKVGNVVKRVMVN